MIDLFHTLYQIFVGFLFLFVLSVLFHSAFMCIFKNRENKQKHSRANSERMFVG